MADKLIYGGTLINEGETWRGYIIISGERIKEVGRGDYPGEFEGEVIDVSGMLVIPGVIDDHVHFRQPGLTHKGDIGTESAAGLAGGVTSYMEMPNTKPATTSIEMLNRKYELGEEWSLTNYAFYFGATNDNIDEIARLDPRKVCGVKVFLGSSTGNMLVDNKETLARIFAESPVPVVAHCEDEDIIRQNISNYKTAAGAVVPPRMHYMFRSAEACYRSSAMAVELADKYGADLHVLHISTAQELSLFSPGPLEGKKITSEVCVPHLWYSMEDYAVKGNLIKCNPSIKEASDRDALRKAVANDDIDIVATDHAPHILAEKSWAYWECPSGMPTIQHSLPAMMELSNHGIFPLHKVIEKMCHAPAVRFRIKDRGFLRPGYYADIAVVAQDAPWFVGRDNIMYKCGWAPMEGMIFTDSIVYTIINGTVVFRRGEIAFGHRGIPLVFDR